MENKTKIIAVIAIFIILSSVLSCRYVTDVAALNDVEVTVEGITLQELRVTYCTLKLSIDIFNPTHQDISGLSAIFDVSIADNYVGSGSFPKSFIPAQSNSKKDVTLTIYYADVANAVLDGIQNRNFVLTIEGEAKGNVFFDLFTVSRKFVSTYSYP